MKKKKLIILAGPLDSQSAGIHRVTYEMIHALHNAITPDFDIILIREQKSSEFPKFKTIHAPVLNFIPGYKSLRLFVILPLICRLQKADIVFEPAHMGPFNLPSRIKRITLIHDLTPVLLPWYHRFLSAWLQRQLLPGVLRRSDRILCLSDCTQSDLHRLFPATEGKVSKIPIGPSSYLSIPPQEKILKKYGIQRPYILTFGTIEPRKNLNFLLDAFASFKLKNGMEYQLVIAGSPGWKTKAFYEALKNHRFNSDIILTSYISDDEISSLYYYADINISCSHYEGFGISAFEAMYLNKPTVLPFISSFKETGKDYACFYSPGSSESLLSALNNCLNPSTSGNKEYPHKAYYSWKNFTDIFRNILRSL